MQPGEFRSLLHQFHQFIIDFDVYIRNTNLITGMCVQ